MKLNTTYQAILQSPRWQERRKSILIRDSYRCSHCGAPNANQVHHKQYHTRKKSGAFVAPWDYLDKYLITVCIACHKSGHALYKIPVFDI